MASVAGGAAAEVQRLLFPSAYGSAAGDLRWMVWGYSGYSLAVTSAWILNSGGRSRVALGVVLSVLVAVSVAATLWVPTLGNAGAARAVALAGGIGAVGALWALAWAFRAWPPGSFVLKLALAVAATAVVGELWAPDGKVLALVKLVALTLTFGAVVFGTKAITRAQLEALRRAG
jgi:O-antigen/teichoic acid export membrane protein